MAGPAYREEFSGLLQVKGLQVKGNHFLNSGLQRI